MKRATLIFASIIFAACWALAGQTPLISDPLVAPATGQVTYQRQGNQTRLTVRVTHLKAASELKPSPRKAYVVWVQEAHKQWRNLGVLQLSNGVGSLNASVPTDNMFVLITAENNPHGNVPTGPEVMQATLLGQ